ncbi:MAG: UxaA family hydrolase [Planctomycetota bacterium]
MTQFIVHEKADLVGVVVVEGVKAGATLAGWVMREDQDASAKVLQDIPLGHKFALKDLPSGATVIKYGIDIGKTVAPIKAGEHVHVHNLKTKRW